MLLPSGASISAKEPRAYPEEVLQPVRRSVSTLCNTLQDPGKDCIEAISAQERVSGPVSWTMDDHLLKEQLEFVQQVSSDISRITAAMGTTGAPGPAQERMVNSEGASA